MSASTETYWMSRALRAEDENERLKVCGTCYHCNTQDQPECHHPAIMGQGLWKQVSIDEPCERIPPSWTPYWWDET